MGDASNFMDGIDKIIEQVGSGHLKGSVEVDQVYAHYQHENPQFKHPRGGKAYYLRDPLFAGVNGYMEKLAGKLIDEDGHSSLKDAMVENMENLAGKVELEAPVEFWDLRQSGHPQVTSDGVTVYDRAPLQHRLSAQELKGKARLRSALRKGGGWK